MAEPALAALLLGKTAQASERGIALTLTEDSQVGDDATRLLPVSDMITVVGNLIDNALDATDPDDPWVEVTIVGDATHLEATVADDRQRAALDGVFPMLGVVTVIWLVTGPVWALFSASDD